MIDLDQSLKEQPRVVVAAAAGCKKHLQNFKNDDCDDDEDCEGAKVETGSPFRKATGEESFRMESNLDTGILIVILLLLLIFMIIILIKLKKNLGLQPGNLAKHQVDLEKAEVGLQLPDDYGDDYDDVDDGDVDGDGGVDDDSDKDDDNDDDGDEGKPDVGGCG